MRELREKIACLLVRKVPVRTANPLLQRGWVRPDLEEFGIVIALEEECVASLEEAAKAVGHMPEVGHQSHRSSMRLEDEGDLWCVMRDGSTANGDIPDLEAAPRDESGYWGARAKPQRGGGGGSRVDGATQPRGID